MNICVASPVPICRLWLRGQVLCHEFMVETRHHSFMACWFFGWNFHLSTIQPLKFSVSQKLLKNTRNKALASCLGIWQAQRFHEMVGLFSIGQRKGQTWESTISMDLRIQRSSRISQNHVDLQVLIFYHSCSLLLCLPMLLLILIPWFSLKSLMFRNSKFDLSGRGGAHFLLGRCFPFPSVNFGHSFPDPVQQGDSWGRPKAQGQARTPAITSWYGKISPWFKMGCIHSRWLFGISEPSTVWFLVKTIHDPQFCLTFVLIDWNQSYWCFELDLGKVFR